MSQLSLGAINKLTGEYVYPKIANKKDEYTCLECNKDLILCQGEIRAHHFRHKVDCVNPCHHYSNPTESQIHKDAKLLLKSLLERKNKISCIRNCCSCKQNEEFDIPEISETSVIEIEYRFEFNGLKIADVAYIDRGELVCIFEICNTHKTSCENRPEPWFEIDAEKLIRISNDITLMTLQLPCIRCEKCEDCIAIENANLKHYNIEKYVRIKKGHLKFDFDARKDTEINKQLVELFEDDFMNKKIAVHTYKGLVHAYIISKLSYSKYDYWDETMFDCMKYPFEKMFDFTCSSTVEIIIKLINYCKAESIIKEEKIKTIKRDIIDIENHFIKMNKEIYGDDDADAFRSMRYRKQASNHKMSLNQELVFIENDINYTLGNNTIMLEHPLTHTTLKRSLVNNKTFYKGKWRTDISVKLIISWYSSNYDLLDELIR